MAFFDLKLSVCHDEATTRSFGQLEEAQRIGKRGFRRLNSGEIFRGFRFILKPDNIRARRVQFHGDIIALNSDVELANAMLMGVKLAGLFSDNRRRHANSEDKREFFRHGKPIFNGTGFEVRLNLFVII